MSEEIRVKDGSANYVPNGREVESAMCVDEYSRRYQAEFFQTLRLLLLAGFCLILTIGCATRDELASLKQSLRATETVVQEHTTALAAIKASTEATELPESQAGTEVISSETDPQIVPDGNESQSPITQPDATTAVRLFVTHAPFNCPPCNALDAAEERGDLAGFEVIRSDGFDGITGYPAIRFEDTTSPTGWRVRYGWSGEQLAWLKANLLPTTNQFVSHSLDINPVMSHSEMKALHDQLHGGGSWTWPGDLATHLQTTHGVQLTGIREQPVRLVSRGSACSTGNCPTSRRGILRWRR